MEQRMEAHVTKLREMVGRLIVARIPALDPNDLIFVKLLRLEAAGVWIESHRYNAEMLERFDVPVSSTTLIQFVPFAAISYIVSSIEKTVLSGSAFGLDE
jgi:hypothetical protein